MTEQPRCPNPECGDVMFHCAAYQDDQVREVWRCRNQGCKREVVITAWTPINHYKEARRLEGDL